jgi:cytochrome c1
MKKLIIFTLISVYILLSCSPSLYIPASSDPVLQQKLLEGRKLYVRICSSCHNLHLPRQYNAESWRKNLNLMQERAKITDEEKEIIFLYLNSQP